MASVAAIANCRPMSSSRATRTAGSASSCSTAEASTLLGPLLDLLPLLEPLEVRGRRTGRGPPAAVRHDQAAFARPVSVATLRPPDRVSRPLAISHALTQRAWRVNRNRHCSRTADGSDSPRRDVQPSRSGCAGQERRVVECLLEWRHSAAGPWRCLWAAESLRGIRRHHLGSASELDSGNHSAAWQEPDLFTTEIRAAFRSLR